MHQKPIDVAGSLFTVLVAGEGSVMAVMGPERRSERKKRPCQPPVFLFLSSKILLFFVSFGFYLPPPPRTSPLLNLAVALSCASDSLLATIAQMLDDLYHAAIWMLVLILRNRHIPSLLFQ